MVKNTIATAQDASGIALKLLEFMAEDGNHLWQFMELAGLSPGDLKHLAASLDFQAGLLDHVLANESLLLAFAANQGLNPAAVVQARARLPGYSP